MTSGLTIRGARAANGDAITAGNTFTASATTGVTTTRGNGLQGSNGDEWGSGVYGEATSQIDPYGYGVAGRVMLGGYAIYGDALGDGIGVLGQSQKQVGVLGKGPAASEVRDLQPSPRVEEGEP